MDATGTFRGFSKIARLSREVVVTEKLDGTNAQVHLSAPGEFVPTSKVIREFGDGRMLLAGSRSRYITPEDDNFGFARWVADHADDLAALGVGRHYGEWYGSGIQRDYGLLERRFALFNVSRWGEASVRPACCECVPVLHRGPFNTAVIDEILESLGRRGSRAAPGFLNPEGIVVFHTASGALFKKTLENDETGKERKA